MSTGTQIVSGSLDFEESNPDVSPAGRSRLSRKGGVLGVSSDGGAFSALIPNGQGAYLTDADQTINPAADKKGQYIMRPGATGNRTITVANGGTPVANQCVDLIRQGTEAFTFVIKDGAAATLITVPSGNPVRVTLFFSGGTSNWILSAFYPL